VGGVRSWPRFRPSRCDTSDSPRLSALFLAPIHEPVLRRLLVLVVPCSARPSPEGAWHFLCRPAGNRDKGELVKNRKSTPRVTSGASDFGRACAAVSLGIWLATVTGLASAGVMFGESPVNTIGGGFRWDAAPKTIAGVGERSLDGALRYSLQGGSFTAYRDLFQWSGGPPSVAAFQTAVQQAFFAWAVPDPASRFTTGIRNPSIKEGAASADTY
jgi:hypothetical protein